MGMVDSYKTANAAWISTMHSILIYGANVAPRGKQTKEILNNSFSFCMDKPVCYHPIRKLSYKFMAAEALWITSGDNSVRGIAEYNKNIAQFSDNGEIFNGAYGPPFVEQVPYIVRTLKEDPDSRQAVATIWNRRPEKSKDIPCTVAFAWNIRNNQINCHVFMRSSDAWLGLPYDVFNFTIMTSYIASHIGNLYPGRLYMNLVSSHLYEPHWEGANQIVRGETVECDRPLPRKRFCDWGYVRESLVACRDMHEDKGDYWRIRP